jgi:hypothetical protein
VSLSDRIEPLHQVDFDVEQVDISSETLWVSGADCTGGSLSERPPGNHDASELSKGLVLSESREDFGIFVTDGRLETLCVSNASWVLLAPL